MATIAKLLVALGIDASDYGSGLDKATQQTSGFVDRLNSTFAPAVGAAFLGAGAAAVAFGVQSTRVAGDFEGNMNTFASVAGTSITDAGLTLDDFQSKFLELGASTAFSAAQAQQAAIELAKGGVPIASVFNDATDATLALAAAGDLDLANAATVVAKQLGVWSSEGVTAANVADIMAQAANASTVDVEELALGMANAGGISKIAGATFEETATTLALLSPGFSSAADAGTSLKTFMSRLIPTSDAATAMMEDLGLASENTRSVFYDSTGTFVGMSKAAELLHTATKDLPPEMQQLALQTIFGSDALRAAAIIAENGAAGFNATTAAMTAAGSAAEQAAIRNRGFNFALDSLMGSVETLQIILGGAFLPVLTDVINTGLIPSVNAVSKFVSAIANAPDPLKALTDAATQFSPILGAIIPIAVQVAGIIGNNLKPILIAVAAVMGGIVVSTIASMVAAFLTVAAPIIAMIAVAAALYAAYQTNFFGIRDLVDSVMNAVAAIIQTVASAIQSFWAAHGAAITASAIQVWNVIYATIKDAVALVRIVITTVFDAINNFLKAHGTTITALFLNLWNVVTGIFTGATQIIRGIIQMFIGIVQGDWTQFAQGTASIVTGLLTLLRTIFDSGLMAVKNIINTALEAVRGVLLHFAGQTPGLGRDIINGIINGIKSGVGALVDAVRSAAMRALNAAKSALGISSPSKLAAAEIGVPFVQGIQTGINSMLGSLSGTASGAAGVLGAAMGTAMPYGMQGAAIGQGGTQYTVTAQYTNMQDERSLRDDLRMIALLNDGAS